MSITLPPLPDLSPNWKIVETTKDGHFDAIEVFTAKEVCDYATAYALTAVEADPDAARWRYFRKTTGKVARQNYAEFLEFQAEIDAEIARTGAKP